MKTMKKELSPKQRDDLLNLLRIRFEKNMQRHRWLDRSKVEVKLKKSSKKLRSLSEMERTGGEPDVVEFDKKKGEYLFYDCSPQSPTGRRSCCYDSKAQKGRKEHASKTNALDMATAMGIEILTEVQYRLLQKVGTFDTTTSSWIATPADIRKLGGALFCDCRYETTFLYHNGADSYYAARWFRGALSV